MGNAVGSGKSGKTGIVDDRPGGMEEAWTSRLDRLTFSVRKREIRLRTDCLEMSVALRAALDGQTPDPRLRSAQMRLLLRILINYKAHGHRVRIIYNPPAYYPDPPADNPGIPESDIPSTSRAHEEDDDDDDEDDVGDVGDERGEGN